MNSEFVYGRCLKCHCGVLLTAMTTDTGNYLCHPPAASASACGLGHVVTPQNRAQPPHTLHTTGPPI